MRLFVPLTRSEFERLRELALAERRRPQDQAAVLIVEALASGQRGGHGIDAAATTLLPAQPVPEQAPVEAGAR